MENLPPLNSIKGNVEFRNVSFKFQKSSYVLKNINLEIKHHALWGLSLSGSGKVHFLSC